ncbi:Dhrs1, partial [Symbiodinium microadriaticum]
FSAFVYVADEEEGVAKLDVLRLGDQSRESRVKWITTDASGKASQIFEHAEGTLHFGPGDGAKQILVHLQRNDNWSSILDFGVMLKEDGLVNAQLGRYGSSTRVKVVDKDAFPSNEFSDIGHFEEEPPFEAMTHHSLVRAVRDFCWLNFTSNEKVRWGTIKQILLDTYTNLFKLAYLGCDESALRRQGLSKSIIIVVMTEIVLVVVTMAALRCLKNDTSGHEC